MMSDVTINESNYKSLGHDSRPHQGDGISENAKQRIDGLIRGFKLVLEHHDAPEDVLHSFGCQVYNYLAVESEAVFFKRAKYLCVLPMSLYLKADAPKVPDKDFVSKGHWKRWSSVRLRKYCNKNTHLWYSFLQCKRSALPLSEEIIFDSLVDHRANMINEDPVSDLFADEIMGVMEPLLEKWSHDLITSLPWVGNEVGDCSDEYFMNTPSNSACYEASRTTGGQSGYLRRRVFPDSRFPEDDDLESDEDDDAERYERWNKLSNELHHMSYRPWVYKDGRFRTNVVKEHYWQPDRERQWREILHSLTANEASKPLRQLKCKVKFVLEPLKIRIISCGESVPYYFAKVLQKNLHTILRRESCFRLIGRPISPTDLFDLVRNRAHRTEGDHHWMSVDYSSATDCVSAKLADRILTRLLGNLPPWFVKCMKQVLAPHELVYPKLIGVDPDIQEAKLPPVLQTNGQLMGSILSFPILCIENLAAYLMTLKDDKRSIYSKLRGVLINGDDMLYVGPKRLFEKHTQVAKSIGLKMSVGKAYVHKRFANANSTCFDCDLRGLDRVNWSCEKAEDWLAIEQTWSHAATKKTCEKKVFVPNDFCHPVQINFLNTGLFFGQSKVLFDSRKEGFKLDSSIVSTINELLRGCRNKYCNEILAGFLSLHKSKISLECRGRNLFISKALGGMGVICPEGFSYKVTGRQKQLATKMLLENKHIRFGIGPIHTPIPEEQEDSRDPWLFPTTVEENFVFPNVSKYSHCPESLLTLPTHESW